MFSVRCSVKGSARPPVASDRARPLIHIKREFSVARLRRDAKMGPQWIDLQPGERFLVDAWVRWGTG